MSSEFAKVTNPLARVYVEYRRKFGNALLGMLYARSIPGSRSDATILFVTSEGSAKPEARRIAGAQVELFVASEGSLAGRLRSGRDYELARVFADGRVFADPRGAIVRLKDIPERESNCRTKGGPEAERIAEGRGALRRYRRAYGQDRLAAQLALYDLLPVMLRIALHDGGERDASAADLFAAARQRAPDVARLVEIVLTSPAAPRPQVVEFAMQAALRKHAEAVAVRGPSDEPLEATG